MKSPVAVMLVAAALCGQSLEVPASTVRHGGSASLLVRLISVDEKAPAALQWDLAVPTEVTVNSIFAGSAAESAGKKLTCAPRQQAEPGQYYTCILAGGQQAIGSGTIAVLNYDVPVKIRSAKFQVRLTNVIAVCADSKKIDVSGADGTITVR
jgi:hypothetical protein